MGEFESPGIGLWLSVSGYDVSNPTEVKVLVNGQFLAYLSVGPRNALNAGDSFFIDASMQQSGHNEISFEQEITGRKWGVTNILLSAGDNLPPSVGLDSPAGGAEFVEVLHHWSRSELSRRRLSSWHSLWHRDCCLLLRLHSFPQERNEPSRDKWCFSNVCRRHHMLWLLQHHYAYNGFFLCYPRRYIILGFSWCRSRLYNNRMVFNLYSNQTHQRYYHWPLPFVAASSRFRVGCTVFLATNRR